MMVMYIGHCRKLLMYSVDKTKWCTIPPTDTAPHLRYKPMLLIQIHFSSFFAKNMTVKLSFCYIF